jgi:flagellar basal-body rod modification protein FlgD
MQVSGVNAATSATGSMAGQASPAKTLGYDQFLQLLVAQLRNQDPTNPADSTQFVSQLASFSAVEQQVQTNARLNQVVSSVMIGRTLTSADGSVSGIVVGIDTSAANGSPVTAILDNGQTLAVAAGDRVS